MIDYSRREPMEVSKEAALYTLAVAALLKEAAKGPMPLFNKRVVARKARAAGTAARNVLDRSHMMHTLKGVASTAGHLGAAGLGLYALKNMLSSDNEEGY
jgi:hypothetical protein